MTKIPLVDLRSQYFSIQKEIDLAIENTILTSDFSFGKNITDFEQQFTTFCGTRYAVGVASGTAALHISLLALGIKNGDEVITVPNTFVATVNVISYVNAKPIFVDINPETFTMDTSALEKAITPKTKAIIPVHLYGHPADMIAITKIAKKHSLFVIEDASQAHGAELHGKKVGTFGDLSSFSFYPSKVLGAYGEAGCVTTDNLMLAERIRILRNHGSKTQYEHKRLGFNYRMDGMQAAILLAKLGHLNKWIIKRRNNAIYYNRLFQNDLNVICPQELPGYKHVYHLYVIRVKKNRDKLREYLLGKGIATGIHYPKPVHLQSSYAYLGFHKGAYPVTEAYSKEMISLPLYPELTYEQIRYIVNSIKSFYN